MSKDRVEIITSRALQIASVREHEYLMAEHILSSLLQEKEIIDLLKSLGCDVKKLKNEVETHLDQTKVIPKSKNGAKKTTTIERVYHRAYTQAIFSGRASIDPEDLLISILTEDKTYAYYYLMKNGVSYEKAIEKVTKQKYGTANAEELIKKFCKNLNEQCEQGTIDPIIGREEEVQNLIEVLSRRRKNNAILVGPAGVGKTAIAEGLAMKIIRKDIQKQFHDKIVYSLDIGSIMAGTKYRGDLEERIKLVIDHLAENKNSILFIDEIHMIIGAGTSTQSSVDIANLLKPKLAKGELRCIGATTSEEFTTHFEKDPALMRRFKRIEVEEPSVDDTKRILVGLRKYYEDFHKVDYTDESLFHAVDLSDRYIKGKYLPDKAIDIIDAAGAKAKLASIATVTLKEIQEQVCKVGKIQAGQIDVEEHTVYENLSDRIKHAIYGQDGAVDNVVESVLVSRSGLQEGNKPIGSFLFIGPTGVGKAQPLYSKVKTPDGWKIMGDIQVGDVVSTPNGSQAKVIGTFPQGEKNIYEVTFEDGRTARSCKEHIWRIFTDNQYVTATLGDIRDRLREGEDLFVELIDPPTGLDESLPEPPEAPIHPYVIGSILSAGRLFHNAINIDANKEVLKRIKQIVPHAKEVIIRGCNSLEIRDEKFIETINNLRLLTTKPWETFIPELYMNASYEQKTQLLKGIFDNAGRVENSTAITNSISEKLLLDIRNLIWSIGGWANLNSVNLTVKHKNLQDFFTNKIEISNQEEIRNKIVDVTLVEENQAKCILLDSVEHLYITDNYVVTHNTELCRELAKNLGIKLMKIDMSEYSEKHTVSKLIGPPPGYVGHGQGSTGQGQLITMIEENPNCVLLLDEIEKAAPEVFQLLLQIMDDAKLSSSSGKKSVDFSNVILIMTSNLGAQSSEKQAIGFVNDSKADEDTKAAKEFFTPEFRNRLDATVRFNKLELEHILLIVNKVIDEVNVLSEKNNVTIKVSQEAKEWLANKGFDPLMGARPLKRVINEEIKKPLSREILFGDLREGGTAYVIAVDDKIEIRCCPASTEPSLEIPELDQINM